MFSVNADLTKLIQFQFRLEIALFYKLEHFKCLLIILTGSVGRVFANGPGDFVLIPGRVIPKTSKMVLDTSLLNTQQYKVHIKGKVDQS